MTREDLVGVYRGLGEETVGKDGKPIASSTRNSQIVYTPDGYMSVVSTIEGRNKVADTGQRMDLTTLSTEERDEAAKNVVAYAGRYSVEGNTVHHHIDMALNPNLAGQTRSRQIQMNGDDLTLSTLPDADGSFGRIRWRRVR